MNDSYDLEKLILKFKEHSVRSKKEQENAIKDFTKSYPEEPLPVYLSDSFDLPFALSVICEEIVKLKKDKK